MAVHNDLVNKGFIFRRIAYRLSDQPSTRELNIQVEKLVRIYLYQLLDCGLRDNGTSITKFKKRLQKAERQLSYQFQRVQYLAECVFSEYYREQYNRLSATEYAIWRSRLDALVVEVLDLMHADSDSGMEFEIPAAA